jgi:hypothetical protein
MQVASPWIVWNNSMNETELATLRRPLEALPYRTLFATVSGAHLYGFASADSDVDLRGAHILPVMAVVGLSKPEETVTRTFEHAGREIDLVAHDVKRQHRNPTRAELERRFGYDTKHAMHLLRLLKMGAEILETGQVHVYRRDREWLMAVRDGLLTYDELLELAAAYESRLEELYWHSPLPEAPDSEAAEALVMELQERFLWDTRNA